MHTRFFEDFAIGQTFHSRGVTITEASIVDFANAYDPQPLHTDSIAAERGPFQGLIASGFQTLVLTVRLFFELGLFTRSGMAGPGIDEVRWLLPVRPGDTIHTVVRVKDIKSSTSKPDRGSVVIAFVTLNQHEQSVMTFLATYIARRRPSD